MSFAHRLLALSAGLAIAVSGTAGSASADGAGAGPAADGTTALRAQPHAPATGQAAAVAEPPDPRELVPAVQRWRAAGDVFDLPAGAAIVLDGDLPRALTGAFATDVRSITGRRLPLTHRRVQPGDIVLRIDPTLPPAPVTAGDAAAETYRIEITDRIVVTGIGAPALARGMQTVQQLFTLADGRRAQATGTIDDWPLAGDRGVMLDAGRHYYQIPYIKQLIREMAWLKLNTLHLHLTEWNGFRLNSPKFPGLAAEESYDKADIAEIEAEAAKYGIEILPEIDLPAHATAITTMWPELNWTCPSMGTMFGTANYTVNVTKPETFARTKELLDEFIPWFSGPRFHVGTDEYPTDGAQKACPELVEYAEQQGYGDTADVFVHYINAMNDIVREHGKTTVAWDWWRFDQHPTIDIDKNITVEAWTNDGEQFLADGYQVLIAPASHFYVTPGAPPGRSLQPNTSWLTDEFSPRTEPAAVGYLIPRWSDNAESQTDHYFDWFAHRPQQVLADRAWGATDPTSPSSPAAIEDRIDRLGPPPDQPWRSQPDARVLTGTVFASSEPWDAAGDPAHAFDGDPASAVDLLDESGYVGIDLGDGNQASISAVRFMPRAGAGIDRVHGGTFQGCTDGPDSGCADLAAVEWKVPHDWMQVPVTDPAAYRWFRWVSPAGGHANIAEIQFLTAPVAGVLGAEITAGPLAALGHGDLTVTLRNTGDQPLTSPRLSLLAVGQTSSARRPVRLDRLPQTIPAGGTITVPGRVDVPLDTPGEVLQLQATATATTADDALVVARATANRAVPQAISAVVEPGVSPAVDGRATATVRVTNDAAVAVEATLTPEPADGIAVAPARAIVRVPAGGTAAHEFTVTVADEPGVVGIPVRVQASARGSSTVVRPAPTIQVSTPYPGLAAARNVHGITDDADPAPPDLGGGIDGDGSSYSWQALADAGVQPGGTVEHGGYTFDWPERAAVDSVIADQQLITVGDTASGIGFLTTGAWGTVSGTGTITYADGTSADFRITDPDWQAPALPPDTEVALTMPYHNLAGTGRIDRNTYIYFHDVPADPDKTIATVTLPGSDQGGRYHVAVFAMALRN